MVVHRTKRTYTGFTLIELSTAILAGSILMLGVAGIIADHHRALRDIHERAFGGVATEARVTEKIFDRFVRCATARQCIIGRDRTSLEVYYRSDHERAEPDQYAAFYTTGTDLVLERGLLAPGTYAHASDNQPDTMILAHHVSRVAFSQAGAALHMKLGLDDGTRSFSLLASALRHNH